MKFFTFAASPYARKVRMALDYKSVAYEPMERCYSLDRKTGGAGPGRSAGGFHACPSRPIVLQEDQLREGERQRLCP